MMHECDTVVLCVHTMHAFLSVGASLRLLLTQFSWSRLCAPASFGHHRRAYLGRAQSRVRVVDRALAPCPVPVSRRASAPPADLPAPPQRRCSLEATKLLEDDKRNRGDTEGRGRKRAARDEVSGGRAGQTSSAAFLVRTRVELHD